MDSERKEHQVKDLKSYAKTEDCPEDRPMTHQDTCAKMESSGRQTDARKAELFQLAQSIVAQVKAMTHRRERCFLNNMVQLLLDE